MSDFELLVDMYKACSRQGPGGDPETELALSLSGLDSHKPLKVADIGCGTGASSLALARSLNAHITAVDLFPEFLEQLNTRADSAGLAGQISTLEASMEDLPFADDAFDLIWSEGAIYNMGFEKGVQAWRRHLKAGGVLAVSEITWTTASRPAEIENFWSAEYPEIDVASGKIRVLEQNGFAPLGYFVLPEHCWLGNFYHPLLAQLPAFLERHGHSDEASALVAATKEEIALYERFKDYFNYGIYVAKKVD